jgi:hypothetical protein
MTNPTDNATLSARDRLEVTTAMIEDAAQILMAEGVGRLSARSAAREIALLFSAPQGVVKGVYGVAQQRESISEVENIVG